MPANTVLAYKQVFKLFGNPAVNFIMGSQDKPRSLQLKTERLKLKQLQLLWNNFNNFIFVLKRSTFSTSSPLFISVFNKEHKDWDYIFLSVRWNHLPWRKPELLYKLVRGAVMNEIHGKKQSLTELASNVTSEYNFGNIS